MSEAQIHCQGCTCDWRPKCESLGPCGEFAVTSEWKPDYATGRWRPVWLCNDHLQTWRERLVKLPGITRPDHADEYWRPSLADHIRLSLIAAKFEERHNEPPPPIATGYLARHQYNWTKQQWANHAAMIEGLRRAQR